MLGSVILGELGVYPRVGGGTPQQARHVAALPGLSPRGRGNPQQESEQVSQYRSIPAWAGEPYLP